jgi:hypothetical protein
MSRSKRTYKDNYIFLPIINISTDSNLEKPIFLLLNQTLKNTEVLPLFRYVSKNNKFTLIKKL